MFNFSKILQGFIMRANIVNGHYKHYRIYQGSNFL